MTDIPAAAGARVLVVDGDELVRWSVAEGLRDLGYAVTAAADSGEALEHGADAALVLLDGDLPGVDGPAGAAALSRRNPGCVVVLTTADPTPELRRRARENGVATVLGKPFSLERLVSTIQKALTRRSDQRQGPVARGRPDPQLRGEWGHTAGPPRH